MSRQDCDIYLSPIAKELNECTVFERIEAPRAYVVNIADLHQCSKHQNKRAVKRAIEVISKTKNMLVILGGDSTENAVLMGGPTQAVTEQNKHGFDQVLDAKKTLLPIADRIKLIRSGNHGSGRAKKSGAAAPERVLAELMDIKYCEGFAALILNVNKNMYTISTWHNNKNPNKFEWLHSDVTLFEHKHLQGYNRSLIAGVNGFTKTWTVREHLDVQAGSFLSWGGYAKEAGYRPTIVGCPILEFSGETNKWEMRVHEKLDHFIELAKARGDYAD